MIESRQSESHRHPSITQTSPSDWSYTAEGGATVVFSYRGSPNPTFSGNVLRLRKINATTGRKDRSNSQATASQTVLTAFEEEEEEPDDPTIGFQARVISRLIPSIHLPHLQSILLERTWLQELHELTNADRPVERRAKDGIDVTKCKGVLATDLVGGEGWAVEIKPKWGFLPNPRHLSDETRHRKTHFCRHCMHASLKASKGEKAALGYCPLDLFSGNEIRLRRALGALWDAWVASSGAVNNLRVFVQGKVVNPSDETARALADQLSSSFTLEAMEKQFIAAILPLLSRTGLLCTLSRLQRFLDPLDVERLMSLWRSVYGVSPITTPSPFAEPDLSTWQAFVDSYFDTTFQEQLRHKSPNAKYLQHYVMAYLLSATFKDCSIIMRLAKGETVENTITAIDLDVKSIDKLAEWEALDSEIVRAFDPTGKAICVDARSSEWRITEKSAASSLFE